MTSTPRPRKAVPLTLASARRLWLDAQRLTAPAPFGAGPDATPAAVRHLGYVQIDTIAVIERCHHHILWSRIPEYRREHLGQAQGTGRSVFEYWTHALSYVPAEDFRFFLPAMKRHRDAPRWGADTVPPDEVRRMIRRIRDGGPLTIRDIDDDVLVEKEHLWASRKPSKRALQRAFYNGDLTISARSGMLKTYELTTRHFGWDALPRPATDRQVSEYLLERALRSQGVISLDSATHLEPSRKPALREAVDSRVRRKRLVPVRVEGAGKVEHWADPALLGAAQEPLAPTVHLLSPFDPLVIQRKRLQLFFGYEHRFEAYVPKEKRVFGYFALPVLLGDEIVAAIDLKTDRAGKRLLIQRWTWVGNGGTAHKAAIEEALGRFETFQLQGREPDAPETEGLSATTGTCS